MVRNWSFEVQFWLLSANHLQHSQSACTKSTIRLCALYYMRIFGRKLELTLNPFFKLFLLSLRLTYILTSDVRRRRFWNFTWREQRSHLDSHDRCKDKTFPENHVKNVFLKVWLYFEFRMNMGFPRTKKKNQSKLTSLLAFDTDLAINCISEGWPLRKQNLKSASHVRWSKTHNNFVFTESNSCLRMKITEYNRNLL